MTTRITDIVDAYLEALDAGNAPDREALLKQHPELAEELAATLEGLDFVHRAARTLAGAKAESDAAPGKALGDFRLLREIGRGGMAVVYEAEQLSLGRRVALKVLPFAAVLDPKQLQRFKNEALAAAHLHHAHIVPVHGVGSDRGVHYYAMQYIEGQSLAHAIGEMKGGGTGEGPKSPISSHGSNREPGYIRMAAALGIDAAEALDHAHQLGIVHRDVKPGNLLVDMAGTLWITDFGLARSRQDVGLTMTGEILGTIRYMSPEQALAKRAPIDHRTDVYSLGATLYELFTLEPAFSGDDPHAVLQDIASREPAPARRLNPALPVDLETILIKAMSKDPAARYPTARDMADDLRRYLEDKPVLARRPSIAARAAKWSRRHRGLVAACLALLLVVIAALVTDNIRVGHERNRAEANLRLARDAVDKYLVEAGIANLEEHPLPPPARQHLLRTALEFCGTDPADPALVTKRVPILHALHEYGEILGILDRFLASHPADAQALVQRGHMLWHLGRFEDVLQACDRAVSLDPKLAEAYLYRSLALDSLGRWEDAVTALSRVIDLQPRMVVAHSNRSSALRSLGRFDEALEAADRALEIDPLSTAAHSNRSSILRSLGRFEEALAAADRALEIDPDSAACVNRSAALRRMGRVQESLVAADRAVALDPRSAEAHATRGEALLSLGRFEEALAAADRALELGLSSTLSYRDRGSALHALGRVEEAVAAFREACKVNPDDPTAHYNLGFMLSEAGSLDAAIAEYREAIRLRPDYAEAHVNLGNALSAKGDPGAGLAELREAIRIRPALVEAHMSLATLLRAGGDHAGAMSASRDAVRIAPGSFEAHVALGNALLDEDPSGAMWEYREAIRLGPDRAEAHCMLGQALMAQGRFEEALPSLRRGHEIGSKRRDWPYPSLESVQSAERGAELERRLERVLSGEAQPSGAPERIQFARFLYRRARFVESAQLYAEALSESPALAEDLAKGRRYDAACSASRAAARGGNDAAQWRGRALEWLRADLAARQKAATGLAQMLEHWRKDPDLAAVRDRIDEMPDAERDAWRRLWTAVDEALTNARR